MNRHSTLFQPTNPFLPQGHVYRYGFNGKESDSQIKGQGLSLDFGARFLDTRIGRWWKTDPAHWKQPHQSLYQSQRNNPIIYTDPNGETEYLTIVVTDFEGNSIMYRKVLSEDVMTDGKRHFESHFLFGKPYGGHYETRYYDLERIYTYSLDGSGNLHECGVQTKILFENGVKDDDLVLTIGEQDKYGDTKDPDGINSTAPYQNIGIYFISNEGGGDQTRFRGRKQLGTMKIDILLSVLSALGRSPNSMPSLKEDFGPVEYRSLIDELSSEVNDLKKSTGSMSDGSTEDSSSDDSLIITYDLHYINSSGNGGISTGHVYEGVPSDTTGNVVKGDSNKKITNVQNK